MTAANTIACAPWCVDGDGHPQAGCRERPVLPVGTAPGDAPGITVYVFKEWHGLPRVRLNVSGSTRSGT
jgi:hypothetical protein